MNEQLITPRKQNGFYTVKFNDHERHFFTMWELIAFLSGTDTNLQNN